MRTRALLFPTVLVLAAGVSTSAQTMTITRSSARAPQQGSADFFTGTVRVTQLFDANDTMRASSASVSFDAGARSAWHTHPNGQLLIVTAGAGRIQQQGGAVQEIRAGDTIWTPPGVKHWHGASPTSSMTHLAIQEAPGGKAVEWLEKVTDAEYNASHQGPPAAGAMAPDPFGWPSLRDALSRDTRLCRGGLANQRVPARGAVDEGA